MPATGAESPGGPPATAPRDGPAAGDDLAGLDALDLAGLPRERSAARRAWAAFWPKASALVLALVIWQLVVWSGWKDEFLFPPPGEVFAELREMAADGTLAEATANTLRLAFQGYLLAVAVGTVVGALVARVGVLRAAFGSLVTGIQTMPSVAWVPWSILLFRQTDATIVFVVVLGASPAIANGLISGSDQVPPILLRAGRVLGARGLAAYRHVLLPAAVPGYVSGLKQGWAFAWRSLMAGEVIVVIAGEPTVGGLLQVNRGLSRADGVLAIMIVILALGALIDALLFATLERRVARRWGLAEAT